MRTRAQLEAAFTATLPPPWGRGVVRLLVRRLGDGEHEVVQHAELSIERGLVGDRWARHSRPSRARQLTLMNVRIAELVADGQPLHLPGDNVLVDLDLSAAAAPVGSRWRLGTAVVRISPEPHTGCAKFRDRFGPDALSWVNEEPKLRRRGVNCSILVPGLVSLGDAIVRVDD